MSELSPLEIQVQAIAFFGVSLDEIASERDHKFPRSENAAHARNIAIQACRDCGISWPRIGMCFSIGHEGAIKACQHLKAEITGNKELACQLRNFRQHIERVASIMPERASL